MEGRWRAVGRADKQNETCHAQLQRAFNLIFCEDMKERLLPQHTSGRGGNVRLISSFLYHTDNASRPHSLIGLQS